ncbi:uncharacterized protein LOC117105778 [Anneissia japonica]|uniref:uncharacterized protein LOC117105778 n=1 Tax=Anneissia japonica TaxID=1529436 RepID=UPI00142581EE|nr:uncharacterized protein LOC117105778 [Anneissia japonica]
MPYEPCNVGWCLKKTVSIVATIATFMIMATSIILYKKLKGRLCNDGSLSNNVEESVEIDGLASLNALREFSERLERPTCTCSLQSNSTGTFNSCGGYILVSPSDPSSMSTHCHCNPSCRSATHM